MIALGAHEWDDDPAANGAEASRVPSFAGRIVATCLSRTLQARGPVRPTSKVEGPLITFFGN